MHLLQAFECHLGHSRGGKDPLQMESFQDVFDIVKHNLSSFSPIVRHLTLLILLQLSSKLEEGKVRRFCSTAVKFSPPMTRPVAELPDALNGLILAIVSVSCFFVLFFGTLLLASANFPSGFNGKIFHPYEFSAIFLWYPFVSVKLDQFIPFISCKSFLL